MSQPLGAHAFAGACGAKTQGRMLFFFRSLPLQIQSRAAFPSYLAFIQDTEKQKEQGGVVQISLFFVFFFTHTQALNKFDLYQLRAYVWSTCTLWS